MYDPLPVLYHLYKVHARLQVLSNGCHSPGITVNVDTIFPAHPAHVYWLLCGDPDC